MAYGRFGPKKKPGIADLSWKVQRVATDELETLLKTFTDSGFRIHELTYAPADGFWIIVAFRNNGYMQAITTKAKKRRSVEDDDAA